MKRWQVCALAMIASIGFAAAVMGFGSESGRRGIDDGHYLHHARPRPCRVNIRLDTVLVVRKRTLDA